MSFPNIPDITPKIDISREDAINLLLISIAMEEISLADLIDAETKKIKHILCSNGHNEPSVQDIKDINKSVDQTVKDVIKLQMLLQFKLENIIEIVGTTTCTSTSTTSTTTSTTSTTTSKSTTKTSTTNTTSTTTSTSTTKTSTTKTSTTTSKSTTKTSTTNTTSTSSCTTTKTKTTTSSTSTKTTTTKRKKCCIKGRARGCVANEHDFFRDGVSILQTYVCEGTCCHHECNFLFYSVQKGDVMEILSALSESIQIECIKSDNKKIIKIKGKGKVERKERCERPIKGYGSFILKLFEYNDGKCAEAMEMDIFDINQPGMQHKSGKIKIDKCGIVFNGCCCK